MKEALDERAETAAKEPRHPIQVVARRTGLSPDVIRVWERRYRAVRPGRTVTNRRLYSDEDLQRLQLLRRATLAGRAIGNVARLDSSALATLVETDEAAMRAVPGRRGGSVARSSESRVAECLDAVRGMDPARLRSAIQSAAVELGTPVLIQTVLAPLMTAVGDEWRRGSMRIHHEHMATALVRALLESLRDGHARAFGGPELVIATAPDEPHELGALMAAALAAADGWKVTYLGPNLPLDEVAEVVRARGAAAVALSIVYRDRDAGLEAHLGRLRRLLPEGVAILVGGHAARKYVTVLQDIGAALLDDFTSFRTELARVKQGRA